MHRHLGPLAAVIALCAWALVACSSGAALSTVGNPVDDSGAIPAPATAAPAQGNSNNQQLADQPLVIYTGTMELEVTDLQASVDQASTLINGLGGHVESSQQSNSGDNARASVTYRIPAERWSDAVAGLRGIGQRVVSLNTQSDDVTAQVIDLDARIANLRSSETALQAIMQRATTIADVLKVQDELTSVQGDIESMTAQRDHLANQAAMGTLTVTFAVPVPETTVASGGWDLGHEVDAALATLVRIAQLGASALIWLFVVALPVIVPVLIVLYVALRIWRWWEARRSARPRKAPSWGPPPPAPPAGQDAPSV